METGRKDHRQAVGAALIALLLGGCDRLPQATDCRLVAESVLGLHGESGVRRAAPDSHEARVAFALFSSPYDYTYTGAYSACRRLDLGNL